MLKFREFIFIKSDRNKIIFMSVYSYYEMVLLSLFFFSLL